MYMLDYVIMLSELWLCWVMRLCYDAKSPMRGYRWCAAMWGKGIENDEGGMGYNAMVVGWSWVNRKAIG